MMHGRIWTLLHTWLCHRHHWCPHSHTVRLQADPAFDIKVSTIELQASPGDCSFIYANPLEPVARRRPAVIVIPGGGLSSIAFANAGFGPWNGLRANPSALAAPQLYLDVGGLGYTTWKGSATSYPQGDKPLVAAYSECIVALRDKFSITSSALLGVSYGGKLARLLQNSLAQTLMNENFVRHVFAVTPFFDPYYTMAYIPIPGDGELYAIKGKNASRLKQLRDDFRLALCAPRTAESGECTKSNWPAAWLYMDQGGLFAKFTDELLGFKMPRRPLASGVPLRFSQFSALSINLWSIKQYEKATTGTCFNNNDPKDAWEVPASLKKTQGLLDFDLMTPTEAKLMSRSSCMMNSEAWNQTAYPDNSYVRGVNITNNEGVPLTVFAGGADVICSAAGLTQQFADQKGLGKACAGGAIPSSAAGSMQSCTEYSDGSLLLVIRDGTHLAMLDHSATAQAIAETMVHLLDAQAAGQSSSPGVDSIPSRS